MIASEQAAKWIGNQTVSNLWSTLSHYISGILLRLLSLYIETADPFFLFPPCLLVSVLCRSMNWTTGNNSSSPRLDFFLKKKSWWSDIEHHQRPNHEKGKRSRFSLALMHPIHQFVFRLRISRINYIVYNNQLVGLYREPAGAVDGEWKVFGLFLFECSHYMGVERGRWRAAAPSRHSY